MTDDPTPRPVSPDPAVGRARPGAVVLAAFAAGAALGGLVSAGLLSGAVADPGATGDREADGRRVLASSGWVLPASGPVFGSAAVAAVAAADSCDALLAEYVERGRRLVGPWGWESPVEVWPVLADATRAQAAAGAPPAADPGLQAAPASATGTTVQERGVDEPDVVKTDGRLLVRLHDDELSTWDVTGRTPRRVGTLGLPGVADGGLLLVGDRAVVLGGAADRPGVPAETEVVVVDLAEPGDPAVLARSSVGARLVEARQHGDAVRLVTATGLPDLDFVEPGDGRSASSALAENRRVVGATKLPDWLPSHTGDDTDDDTGRLLPCDAVGVPAADGGLGTLALTTWLPAGDEPGRPVAATGLLTASDAAYVSADRIYVATAPVAPACCWGRRSFGNVPRTRGPLPGPGRDDGATDLHAFALEGTRTTYLASGAVDGLVRERWWMDERDGVLRVAVAPTHATGDFTSVVTLVEDGDRLVEHGRLDRIGVGEDLKSVRWFDDLAVAVTFRRVDPLHVVDLTDDAAPTRRGELEVPGFSAYLHPLGSQRMIGVGEGPTRPGGRGWGAQAGLFDLADLDAPRQAAVHHWSPGSVAGASRDPRQLTWLPGRRVVLTVVWRSARTGRTGYVSQLAVRGGRLVERSTAVEYGDDVDDVRLVVAPAARGAAGGAEERVLLVTGDGVERFDLPR